MDIVKTLIGAKIKITRNLVMADNECEKVNGKLVKENSNLKFGMLDGGLSSSDDCAMPYLYFIYQMHGDCDENDIGKASIDFFGLANIMSTASEFIKKNPKLITLLASDPK